MLGDGAVVDLNLDVPAPLAVMGTVQMEGEPPGSVSGITVTLVPAAGIMYPSCTSEVKPGGEFLLNGCSPGLYRIRVTSVPPRQYVREVYDGESPVRDSVFGLEGQPQKLKVIVRNGAGRIAGTPATGKSGWYLRTREQEPLPIVLGYAGGDGAFAVDHLQPGRYSIVGLVAPDPSVFFHAESLGAYRALGAHFTIAEKQELQITVPVVSEGIDGAALGQ